MRPLLFVTVFVIGAVGSGCFTQQAEGQKATGSQPATTASVERRPVIVELFTSEGCSSCPPADRALKFLAEQQPVANAEIIPLAFHVDYWDHLGWKDAFSSAVYSRRQDLYAARFGIGSSYTPEMVVDGQTEFIGSDTGRAAKAISQAASRQKGSITADLDGDDVNVSISALPDHHAATLFLVITEDGITSNVTGGENAGETFSHTSVVRSLTSLGRIEKNAVSFQVRSDLPVNTVWKAGNIRYVVFVQDNVSRRIIAADLVHFKLSSRSE